MNALSLPPPFRAAQLAAARSALAAARAAAAASAAEGTLFWSERADRVDCGVVLRPDRPRRYTLHAIYLGALAVADALAAFAAPPAPIGFRWPDGIVIDGGLAGRVCLECAPSAAEAAPSWAVLGFELAIARAGGEPGLTPYVTSIAEEGFDGFSAAGQIEAFARHLLRWFGRWEAEGFAPVAAEWWRRAFAPCLDPTVELPGHARAVPIGLDLTGDLRVRSDGRECILRLEAALAGGIGDG